jgi:hypothetical protein
MIRLAESERVGYLPVTNRVHFWTVFCHSAPENGIVMVALYILRTGPSSIQQSRSPETTWN